MEDINQEEVDKMYEYAFDMKGDGKSDSHIQTALIEYGLDEEGSRNVVDNMNNMIYQQQQEEEDSSGAYGWLIWIGVLILINGLSYAFDWPFYIY